MMGHRQNLVIMVGAAILQSLDLLAVGMIR